MEFFFDFAQTHANSELLKEIDSASKSLFSKLKTTHLDQLDVSGYSKRYLGNYLEDLTYTLQLYSFILSVALAYPAMPLNRFALLDYGGGCGMLSLLAREAGVGTVLYNDLYGPTCRDAEVIGQKLGNPADAYIQGDIDEVVRFLQSHGLGCSAVASHDVIEHIYDVESFIRQLPLLSNGPMSVTMTSGANIRNLRIRRMLMAKQVDIEYHDKDKRSPTIISDCVKSYLGMRREIIFNHARSMNREMAETEIETLAKCTRGLIKADICKAVDVYLEKGVLPQQLHHPTNTCDPDTGNWCEHLLDHCHLQRLLSDAGFRVKILSGYYGRGTNPVKRHVKKLLNVGIRALGRQGIRLAPFFTLYGERDGEPE